jgi:signal transduction histidine kinase
MEPKASKEQLGQDELERIIECLPEDIHSLYASGKSILDLSHLVKNILQMVSGSAEIIQLGLERKQYDRLAKSWTIFEPNFIRLKKFLLDLIKFTKQYPLRTESCEINKCIQNAIMGCNYILKDYAVNVQWESTEGIPAAFLDAERIEEIVSNLITHALDNLPEHQGTITIQTVYLAESKEIELTISDNGPALPLETVRLLRQPYERTRNMCGTGFDIPLTALYAQQHGGYLEIDRTPPVGNAVHVYLPVRVQS